MSNDSSAEKPVAFDKLGLSPKALAAIGRIGFETPTDIQRLFIPAALTGRDCVGRAKTGTGKTAAFLLPIIEHFFAGEQVCALILAPTRELANQITAEARKLCGRGKPRTLAVNWMSRPSPRPVANWKLLWQPIWPARHRPRGAVARRCC